MGGSRPPRKVAPWLEALALAVPDPRCELDYRSPFELLIATQLSAQSTDVMVNRVTPVLFSRWPDAAAMALADVTEMEGILRPTRRLKRVDLPTLGRPTMATTGSTPRG